MTACMVLYSLTVVFVFCVGMGGRKNRVSIVPTTGLLLCDFATYIYIAMHAAYL